MRRRVSRKKAPPRDETQGRARDENASPDVNRLDPKVNVETYTCTYADRFGNAHSAAIFAHWSSAVIKALGVRLVTDGDDA
jgi:hypothetical protein